MPFVILLLCLLPLPALADGPGVLVSRYSDRDFALSADPESPGWKGIAGVFAERGPRSEAVPPGHRTEIRSRWTRDNLYLLFICPYKTLYLKPDPRTDVETNRLWNWDVAEVFLGWDFDHIQQYKELQVSPQGEWVDLDIDRENPKPGGGWQWNSGMEAKARIDADRQTWYGEMRIPIRSLDPRPPEKGREWRLNLYRIEGGPEPRIYLAWQPTGARSYHVPEAFGRLRLE